MNSFTAKIAWLIAAPHLRKREYEIADTVIVSIDGCEIYAVPHTERGVTVYEPMHFFFLDQEPHLDVVRHLDLFCIREGKEISLMGPLPDTLRLKALGVAHQWHDVQCLPQLVGMQLDEQLTQWGLTISYILPTPESVRSNNHAPDVLASLPQFRRKLLLDDGERGSQPLFLLSPPPARLQDRGPSLRTKTQTASTE